MHDVKLVSCMVAVYPPGLQPLTGGREVHSTTQERSLGFRSFSFGASVGLPHGPSQPKQVAVLVVV